ncbi:MAG TPA: PAS domain-containing protein, partial [Nannocystis sp.]
MLGECRTDHELLAAGAFAGLDEDLVTCLDASSLPVFVVDRNGTIAWRNRATRELFRRDRDDCLGLSCAELDLALDVLADIWHDLDAGAAVCRQPAHLATPAGRCEVMLSARAARDPDGALVGIRICILPTRDLALSALCPAVRLGAELERLACARDRAEAALRITQARLHGLIDAAGQIVWSSDPAGHVIEDSPSWRRFTGQTFAEMRGTGWRDAVAAADRNRLHAELSAAMAARQPCAVEYHLRRADGSYAEVRARAVPIFDADGALREWIGVCVDISAQREFERQREALVADLRRAMHYQDMFMAVLGHDLRSPLTAVLMATDLALRRWGGDERMRRVLRQIGDSGRRMLRMIEQLLDVTRIRVAGGLEIRRTRADLAAICRTIIDEVQQAHPGARVVLERRGSTLGAWDVDRLSQLASNLIGNAIQHAHGAPVA